MYLTCNAASIITAKQNVTLTRSSFDGSMYAVAQGTCISDLPTFQPSNPDCQYFSLCILIVSLDTHTLHTLHLRDERVWMSRAGKHSCSFMDRQSSFNPTTARRTYSIVYFLPAGRGLYNLIAE